jgi:hypothetical protein
MAVKYGHVDAPGLLAVVLASDRLAEPHKNTTAADDATAQTSLPNDSSVWNNGQQSLLLAVERSELKSGPCELAEREKWDRWDRVFILRNKIDL